MIQGSLLGLFVLFFALYLAYTSVPSCRDEWSSLSRRNCSVFIVSVAWRESSFRHVREVVSSGPWPVYRVSCPVCGNESCSSYDDAVRSVACAHARAHHQALSLNYSCALILEDDAQLVPSFWSHLGSTLPSLNVPGVTWLDFLVLPVDNFSSLWRQGLSHFQSPTRGWSDLHDLGLLRQPCLWGAGGYFLTRPALLAAVSFAHSKRLLSPSPSAPLVVSEEILCHAARITGGALSSPPLVFQCSGQKKSSVQSPTKFTMDLRARQQLKKFFQQMVADAEKSIRPVDIPDWILEDCVD